MSRSNSRYSRNLLDVTGQRLQVSLLLDRALRMDGDVAGRRKSCLTSSDRGSAEEKALLEAGRDAGTICWCTLRTEAG